MAGRPPLRIGQHGKISRKNLGGGVWLAKCRYRDSDGVTRVVERRGPADDFDKHGKLAEDALIEALQGRRPPGVAYEISLDTKVMDLVGRHIDRSPRTAVRSAPSTPTGTWPADSTSSSAVYG